MKFLLYIVSCFFVSVSVYADSVDIGDGLVHGDGLVTPTNPYWLNPGYIQTIPGGAAWGCNKKRAGRIEEDWLNNQHYGFNVYRIYWMPPQPKFSPMDVSTACDNWDIWTLRENGCSGCITHFLQYFPQEHGWRYVAIEEYGYGALDSPSNFEAILALIGVIIFFSAGLYLGNIRFWY